MALSMKKMIASLDRIGIQLIDRGETIAVAESVTSGHLQAAFSLAKNATQFFQGGLTAYNTGQKTRHLGIDPITAERCNCVSEQVALAMAEGACRLFSSDWSIGVTGYAAPVPAWDVRHILYAYYSFAYKGQHRVTFKAEVRRMSMDAVQRFYTQKILNDLARLLDDR